MIYLRRLRYLDYDIISYLRLSDMMYYPDRLHLIQHVFLFHFRKCITCYTTLWIDIHLVNLSTRNFLHAIQGRTGFEPTDLLLVHRVVQTDSVHFAVFVLDLRFDRLKESHQKEIKRIFEIFICWILKVRKLKIQCAINGIPLSFFCLTYFCFTSKIYFTNLARCQILQTKKTDLIVGLNFIVISRIREGQRQKTLLLQIRFVYTSETFDDNGAATKMTWFQGSVLPGGTFAVILVTYCDPLYVLLLIIACNFRHGTPFIRQLVLDFIHLTIFKIDSTKKSCNVIDITLSCY